MLLFTGNEVLVELGYAKLSTVFAPREIVNWMICAGNSEVIHEKAYSLFTETIGLLPTIYADFLSVNVMKTKTQYINNAKVKNYEEYKNMGLTMVELDREYRRDIAKQLAVYGGGTENVSLFAQFAMLLSYQFQNKYKGLCTIVEYSIRDEFIHHKGNSHVFREFIKENPDIWDDSLKFEIYEAFREMVAYEEALIDYLNPPHMSNSECKQYVRFQADNALLELGMKRNFNVTKNPFPFMEEVTSTILTDFFSGRVTSYSRVLHGDRDELKKRIQNS